ncbi:MAG: 23S rRNA (guanosine(2251)-2'-O)-methyltransferase RlmB [Bacteroidetes bacterium]|nr:23S rRNA (guanosine(2251)-2'-O)-methyltransferase RlmB [Bacteroidota bacterium]
MHQKENNNQLIFGIRPIIEAIESGKEIDKVFVQRALSGDLFKSLFKLLRDKNIYYQFVPPQKLNSLTSKNHQGVVAYMAVVEYENIFNIVPSLYEKGKTPLIIVLDRVTDVRNFGSIARTAECMGVDAIVIPSQGSAQINSEAVKASAGAIYNMSICKHENLKDVLDFLKESGMQIVAASEKTDKYIYDIPLKDGTVIIMGSEENGVSSEYLKRCNYTAKIPLIGKTGSYNVAVATGIVLYEVVRQRNTSS